MEDWIEGESRGCYQKEVAQRNHIQDNYALRWYYSVAHFIEFNNKIIWPEEGDAIFCSRYYS